MLSRLNEGIGGGTIQTFLVSVSGPHAFSIIIDIKNSPGWLNCTSITEDPHVAGLPVGFCRPSDPFCIAQPTIGYISHFLFEV